MRRFGFLALLGLLAACGNSGSSVPQQNFIGLLKVTVSGIGDGATPTAKAEWVKGGVSGQSATVIPVNGTNTLDDLEIKRGIVNFSDDDHTNTRYVYSNFDLTNRTTTNFANLTLYAVNVPTNIGGTGIASMTAATGAAITDESVARGFQPTHAMRLSGAQFEVNPNNADLQLLTSAEATDIKNQAVTQSILTNADTVLEYGFVARNLSGGRGISQRNLSNDCTDNTCKGILTLAYKFPRVNPRPNNPFSFTLYFVVANETNSVVSQSLEEQSLSQAAGLSSFAPFSQVRGLAGTATGLMGEDKLGNLCQVRTAVATVANPSNLLMPATIATSPGSLDSCFGTGGKKTTTIASTLSFSSGFAHAYAVALQSDGKIVVAGDTNPGATVNLEFAVARFDPDGSLDATFNGTGQVVTPFGLTNDVINAVAIQSDGKIVVAGYSNNGTNDDFALARYNPDGSLDTTFDGDGKLTTPIGLSFDQANAIAIQSDGKIVVTGLTITSGGSDFALARYNPDGSLDAGFGTGGKVITSISTGTDVAYALALQSDGKIVIAGNSPFSSNGFDFTLARYNPNGSLDTTFNGTGTVVTTLGPKEDTVKAVAIQSDGKIVAAGYSNVSTGVTNNFDFALARYNPNGTLDTSFDGDGKLTTPIGPFSEQATGVAIQSDGKIVVGGYSTIVSSRDFALVRYLTNGSLDSGFGTGGKVSTAVGVNIDQAHALAIQSDGKMVLAGFASNGNTSNIVLVRYNP